MSDQIIELYEQGMKPLEIAKQLNIPAKYVAGVIIKYVETRRLISKHDFK